MEEKVNEICKLLKLDTFYKELTDDKSVRLIFHPTLLAFLKQSRVTDNKLINKILGPEKVKVGYLKDKHPNFIHLGFDNNNTLRLKYLDLNSIKGRIRSILMEYAGAYGKSVEEFTDTCLEKIKEGRLLHPSVPHDIKLIKKFLLSNEINNLFINLNTHSAIFKLSESKVGKGIQKLFDKHDPKEVEQLVDLLSSAFSKDDDEDLIDIVEGQEIPFYYNFQQYATSKKKGTAGLGPWAIMEGVVPNGCGELGNSCMRYDNCSRAIKFYAENKGSVSMLIYKSRLNKTKIEARAILWKGMNGETYVDRIYSSNKAATSVLVSYIRRNNFINISSSNSSVLPFDKNKLIKIKLQKWNERELPYFDSLKYINIQEGVISNFIYNMTSNFTSATSCTFTDNVTKRRRKIKCCITGDEVWEHETVTLTYGKYKGKRCRVDESAYMRYNDKYLSMKEINSKDFVIGECFKGKSLMLKEDVVYCETLKTYYPISEATYIPYVDDYCLHEGELFFNKKVEITSYLERACGIMNTSYVDEMSNLIGMTFQVEEYSAKGVYVTSKNKTYFIPFSALKIITDVVQKTK